jgi:dolichol-phosphate mannosyltransferase
MRPLVIIPTYNERDDVQRLVPRLLEIPELRVLVVDDMSPDGTGFAAEVLAEQSDGRVSVIHRLGRPRGLGHAALDGLRRALETDADVIFQMDADPSHQPEEVLAMLDAVQSTDLVIGSRDGRTLPSAAATRYVRMLCAIGVRDCTSSIRCWRRKALAALPLHRIDSKGSAALVHMLYEALANGCTVSEVPITVARRARRQTARPRFVAEFVALPWKLLFSAGLKRRPTWLKRHPAWSVSGAASAPPAALQAADSGPR